MRNITRSRTAALAVVLVIGGACFLGACSNTMSRSAPKASDVRVEDSEIVSSVSAAFHDAGVPGYHTIRIASKDGVVTLTGQVANAAAAEQAVKVAQGVTGVKSVDSKIQVKQ